MSKTPAKFKADKAAPENKPLKHLWLVDGSGYIFRAFHALPPLSRPDGTPVNAVFGYCNMLTALLEKPEIDHMAVIFDAGRTTFRNRIYDKYKANRPEPPEELIPQFPLIRDATRAFGVPCVELADYEADDLIATYARLAVEAGADVTIVSSDKDLMQLVNDKVSLMDPMKLKKLGREAVIEKFGVPPEKVVHVQALAGDSTDNVPGVPGIGVKTAAQLIGEYGDLETLLARAGEIKQPKRREALQNNAELARISYQLVLLRNDVPPPEDVDTFDKRTPEADKLIPFLEQQGFRNLLQRYRALLGAPAGTALAAEAPAAAAAPAPQQPKAPVAARETKPFTSADYELIQTEAALDDFVAAATRAGVVAVDCETDALDSQNAGIVGVSLALAEGPLHGVGAGPRRAAYIPLAHRRPGVAQGALDFAGGKEPEGEAGALLEGQLPIPLVMAKLKPLLEDPAILKVGQNLKYDICVFRRFDVDIAPVDDTMLLSFVLDGGKGGHGMDELAEQHLGVSTIKFSDVAGSGKNQVTFDRVPLDKAKEYAAEDADVTMQLWLKLKPRIAAERMATMYETIERPLIPVLLDMEKAGVKVDAKRLRELGAEFEKRVIAFEREAQEIAGKDFNVGSPKQLGDILFGELDAKGGRKTKTGAWGTGADVLDDIVSQDPDGRAGRLAAKVLEWREFAKLKSTYTDALIEQIDAKTGRVHTSYAMTGAATGRLASTDPNLQNIPVRSEEGRKIREAFVAEKGCKLLSADYSQIELRLLAHVASIETLKEAFARGDDIHAMTASQVFDVPMDKMTPDVRRKAKAINFGIIYGISAFGLGRQLGIPQGEAKAYIDAYFKRYPGIRDYMETTKDFARRNGFVATPFGRKIHLRYIAEKNPAMRAFAERAAINAPLQGGAADIIKRAMIRLPAALADAGLKTRMLLQVHDELIFEAPLAETEKAAAAIKRTMEAAASLSVPLVVDTGVGDSWAQAH